jgi:hypothetical protein
MIRSEQVFLEVKNQKLPLTKTQKINFDNTSNDFFCVLFLNTNLFTVKREIEKVPEVPTLHLFSFFFRRIEEKNNYYYIYT